jgi:hypothetical protein
MDVINNNDDEDLATLLLWVCPQAFPAQDWALIVWSQDHHPHMVNTGKKDRERCARPLLHGHPSEGCSWPLQYVLSHGWTVLKARKFFLGLQNPPPSKFLLKLPGHVHSNSYQ